MRNIARYNRGGLLLDLQNQRNHYKLVLQPRKSMRISQEINNKLNLSLNDNKYEKSIRKSRQMENQRLYKALESIKCGKGVIQIMSQKAKQEQKNPKRSTLTTQFRLQQKRRQLKRGNQRIVQKISKVRPKIGSQDQWNRHFQNYQKQIKKISRATQNVFNASDNQDLKSLFRQTIDFHRSRTTKDRSKRNTTLRSKGKRTISQRGENSQNLEEFTQQEIDLLHKQVKIQNSKKIEKNQKNQSKSKSKNENS